jgi:hypothetical protein
VRKLLKFALMGMFILFTAALIFAPRHPPVAASTQNKSADLELIEDSTEDHFIVGRIRNNAAKRYNYAQVTFGVYNAHGEQVGSAVANINGLEPGGTWKFRAPILQGEATRYKLDKITGF